MRALVRWLGEEASRAHVELDSYRVLDVGCGTQPYRPLLEPFASSYVGVDAMGTRARSCSARSRTSRSTPPRSTSSSAARSSSTSKPHAGRRGVSPRRPSGGRVLVSTHGVPTDYRRRTHADLEKLFRENVDWASVRVTPVSGTAACLGMIASINLDLGFHHLRMRGLALPLVAGVDTVARAGDGPSPRLGQPGPGTLFAHLHAVAEVPR